MRQIFGKNSAFSKVFNPKLKSYQLTWKAGGSEVIDGESLSDAWSRKGWSKAKIQELASYKEL